MQRTTSAGYRLPLQTTNPHRTARLDSQPAPARSTAGTGKQKEVAEYNEVADNQIWRERVGNEWKGVYAWTRNFGFMKDFDTRGRPKTPAPLPEYESNFNKLTPATQGRVYGSRVGSEQGVRMQEMQHLFHAHNRKSRRDSELVCY